MIYSSQIKWARLNVPLDVAMALLVEDELALKGRLDRESDRLPRIAAEHVVPMRWVAVPYLPGSEDAVRAILARIAPGVVPLGLCGQSGHTDGSTDGHHSASTPCRHEEGSSPSAGVRSGSPVSPLSAAGSGGSSVEVQVPSHDANDPAAVAQGPLTALEAALLLCVKGVLPTLEACERDARERAGRYTLGGVPAREGLLREADGFKAQADACRLVIMRAEGKAQPEGTGGNAVMAA